MTRREDWIAGVGREWAAHVAATDAALGPFGDEARRRLGLAEGERVLDLGCGAGMSLVALAQDVGGTGRVTGIDVSPDLVSLARNRTAELPNVQIVEADAETHDFGDAQFSALYSRFGCMFFDDPARAWKNLHGALQPNARVSLVAWRELEENEWAQVPLEVAVDLFGPEEVVMPVATDEPGPFSWADPKVFEPILDRAGFREVVREKFERKVPYGMGEAGDDPLDRAVAMMMRIGPLARRLRGADDAVLKKAARKLKRELRPFEDDDAVRMTGRAWSITARA